MQHGHVIVMLSDVHIYLVYEVYIDHIFNIYLIYITLKEVKKTPASHEI